MVTLNKERLNNIIKGNLQLTQDDLEEIKSLTDEFPFCQIGHILSAVAHKQHEHMLSEDKIMTAALHTGNRKNLRSLLNNNISFLPTEKVTVKNTSKVATENIITEQIDTTQKEKTANSEQITLEKTPVSQLLSERRKDISKELEENLALLQNRRNQRTGITTPEEAIDIVEIQPEPIQDKPSFTEEKDDPTPIEPTKTKNFSENITSSRMGDEVSQTKSNSGGSFTDIMLQYLETLEEQRSNKPSIEDQSSIIENFIQKDPNISRAIPTNKKEASTDLAKDSVKPKNTFISENLAKINAKQGNISKALDIYEQLILKYPEKKTYFAKEIEKLKQS